MTTIPRSPRPACPSHYTIFRRTPCNSHWARHDIKMFFRRQCAWWMGRSIGGLCSKRWWRSSGALILKARRVKIFCCHPSRIRVSGCCSLTQSSGTRGSPGSRTWLSAPASKKTATSRSKRPSPSTISWSWRTTKRCCRITADSNEASRDRAATTRPSHQASRTGQASSKP